jgi:regulatory protein YycH of two-component signal transduction system YycFG
MATGRLIHEDDLDELLTLYQMLNPDDPELEKDEELRGQWQEMIHDKWLKTVVLIFAKPGSYNRELEAII